MGSLRVQELDTTGFGVQRNPLPVDLFVATVMDE